MGEECLDFIKGPVFQEKYRIELSPEEGLWKLYLHLDPMAWFDALMSRPIQTRESVIKKAREYVDNVREAYHPSRPEKFLYDPILSKSYCSRHGESWFVETLKIYCQAESPQQKRHSRSCN